MYEGYDGTRASHPLEIKRPIDIVCHEALLSAWFDVP